MDTSPPSLSHHYHPNTTNDNALILSMAEFLSHLQGGGLRPSPSSLSFLDMDPAMDLLRYSNSTSAFHHLPDDNSQTNFFLFPQELSLQPQDASGGGVVPGGGDDDELEEEEDGNSDGKRRKKRLEFSQGSCSASANSSVPAKRRKQGSGGGKNIIKGDEEGEGDRGRKGVVHVRARRGQATDSHSLAERVRRGKINERLRCLQDIVPGCYKTMGLAVMLDEIINYVQSLQSQVEFLSMKLTAASSFYDFNSESDLIDAMRRAKANEAKEVEELLLMRGQFEGNSPTTTTTTTTTSNPISTFHPFDHTL